MDLLYSILAFLAVVSVAFFGGKGFKWNTERKTRKEVLSEIEEHRIDAYMNKKDEFNARDAPASVDAAREFLRDRASNRKP
jgi:hypothetical protein